MKFYTYFYLFFASLILTSSSCRSNNGKLNSKIVDESIVLVDSVIASQLIITDNSDGFFNNISNVDIAIQLKSNKYLNNRSNSIKYFKEFLQQQTSDFSDSEKQYLKTIVEEVKTIINAVNPYLLLKMNLVKIKTDHYGKDVFYTRENTIFIPNNVLDGNSSANLKNVLLHEIYHIISRNQPVFRDKTYGLIGFKRIDGTTDLCPIIKKTLLSNPDGSRMDYYIPLKFENKTINAIPLIISNESNYLNGKESLFNYLKFELFEIEKTKEGGNNVLCKNDGSTTLPLEYMQSFFNQIKDNTQYIIHPDEIMADNFMMALTIVGKEEFKSLSSEGKKLILDLMSILEKYKPEQ